MQKLTHSKIIKEVLENVREDMLDEEIIHLVLEKPVSCPKEQKEDSLGQKIADKIASFGGSWIFIISFVLFLLLWIFVNIFHPSSIDPYPFILLNLLLSCIAAIQAPIIMMSQNRQEKKDRLRNEHDYKVNLKTEIIIQDLHTKLDTILLLLEEKEALHKTKK